METTKKKSFIRGWLQVVSWFFAWVFFNFTYSVSMQYWRPALTELHGFDATLLLNTITISGFASIAFSLVLPKLIEKSSAKLVMQISTFATAAAYMALPYCSSPVLAVICTVIVAVLNYGYCGTSTMVLASKWFPRTKGRVMGIITSAGIVSSGIMLPIFSSITNAVNIQMAMLVMGGVMALWGVINIFLLKETPAECGLLPDNKPMTEEEAKELVASKERKSYVKYKDIVREPRFWILSLGWGFYFCALFTMTHTLVPMFTAAGIATVGFVSLAGYIQTGTSILSGFTDSKWGARASSMGVMVLMIAGILVELIAGYGSVTLCVIIFFLVMGPVGAPNNLYSSQALDLSGPREYAIFFSSVNAVISIMRNFGSSIVAYSLKWFNSYQPGIVAALVLTIIATILIWIAGKKPIEFKALKRVKEEEIKNAESNAAAAE